MNWISVKDRLPENSKLTYVLCFDNDSGVWLGYYEDGFWPTDEGCIRGVVTHWMPLPEPPKDETVSINDLIADSKREHPQHLTDTGVAYLKSLCQSCVSEKKADQP